MHLSTLSAALRRATFLILAAAVISLPDASAQTTYVVQSERDQSAATAATPNGVITLREAIIAANTDAPFGDAPAGSGNDIITFDAGITSVLIGRGELVITDGVTIGNNTSGAKVTLQVRTNAPTRVIDIDTVEPVTLQSLSIEDGYVTGSGGGGVRLGGGGDLTLFNVDFLRNRADDGGGLYVSGEASATLSDVRFEGNRALGDGAANGGGGLYTAGAVTADVFSGISFVDNSATGSSGSGGGLFVADGGSFDAVLDVGTARDDARGLAGPSFNGNLAARAGGAIEVVEGGSVALESAGLFNNRAGNAPGNGGGLHITGAGSASLTLATVVGNVARNEGGGLWNSGTGLLTVVESTISGNSTVGDGGGVYQQAGESGATLISNSTLASNTAARFGGGLFAEGATVLVQNSTLSTNSATRGGGGYADGADVTFESATIAANDASGLGGGFANPDIGMRVSLQNTLVADNTAGSGPQLSGFYVSEGNNLVETRAGAGIAGQQASDLYETDAMIGMLASNGGPTQTHALLAGSPAIDAGMTDFVTDQRGTFRSEPDDIGAFDFGAVATGRLVITGVFDGPLTGGLPKVVELYVDGDIADLGAFGLGSANNGGGTDGEEFSFPDMDSAVDGDYLYVATGTAQFQLYFGVPADYDGGQATNVNGDDAIELFQDGAVIDTFGDLDTDGTGQPWEYLDGWVYRMDGTGPDGSTFVPGNWTYSGINVNDGKSTNTDPDAFPIGTYSTASSAPAPAFADDVSTTGLAPVAPNPVRSTARVRFALDRSEAVTVALYDVMGRRVQTLYTGTPAADVPVDVTVDARALASGVYVVVLEGETLRQTQRVTVAR